MTVYGPLNVRLWSKVQPDPETGCWNWTGYQRRRGYGEIYVNATHGPQLAFRVLYEMVAGPVPEGTELDHTCRNTRCVNPAHMDPVSHRVNVLRGDSPTAINARKTHCVYGHEFTPQNTYVRDHGKRDCRECKNRRDREYRRRNAKESAYIHEPEAKQPPAEWVV